MVEGRAVKVLAIHPDGSARVESIPEELESMRAAIGGGWLEGVMLRGCHLYCDEEGFLKNLRQNPGATLLARRLGYGGREVLRGQVIFLGEGPAGAEGHVPDEVVEVYEQLLREIPG